MARSFSHVKNVSVFVANQISRGYSQSHGVVSSAARAGAPKMMLNKRAEETSKTAWVPDPDTGYYRPDNQVKDVDPAELREALLKNKLKT